ncbi:MAG: T9SS type A sorting domain-containing protein [Mariniphaga sp.]|nr:T9SS type A sorting domain-containing protein [Mariniphaga sp.]
MKRILISLIIVPFLIYGSYNSDAQNLCPIPAENTYYTLAVQECYNLVNSNEENTNFVILDVRTPNEYNPQHIEGAININLYDSDFADQLNLLNKNKTYLVHCKSGSRSTNAFNQMKNLQFRQVFNMSGGINAWNSMGYPTTFEFAPELGIYDCSFRLADTIARNESDTIRIMMTNAANDTLKINSISTSGGEYYSYTFSENMELLGGQDHYLELIFSSSELITDILNIQIESNAGNQEIILSRSSSDLTGPEINSISILEIYPVPARNKLFIRGSNLSSKTDYKIIDLYGRAIKQSKSSGNSIDISELNTGIYFLQIQNSGKNIIKRFVKQ